MNEAYTLIFFLTDGVNIPLHQKTIQKEHIEQVDEATRTTHTLNTSNRTEQLETHTTISFKLLLL